VNNRVEICAAAEEPLAEFERTERQELTTGATGFPRERQDPLAVEFDVESGAEWDELLAQAEFVLRGSGTLPVEEEASSPRYQTGERLAPVDESARERRIYRGRTIAMLRRYMRYSIETGRLPSILGREFFRAKVTSYTVVTFEDRMIFVHDMEKCLAKLDEFSQQLIARHILQEHDQAATGRLLNCTERTVRRLTPIALDLLSEILLDAGLLERRDGKRKKSCQGGFQSQKFVSHWEQSKNKI
jgi:hypothetical protein